MPQLFTLLVLLALALPAAANDLPTLQRRFETEGFKLAVPAETTPVQRGETGRIAVALAIGHEYNVVAACLDGCTRVSLGVLDPGGQSLLPAYQDRATTYAYVEPRTAGAHAVIVQASACPEPHCRITVAVFGRLVAALAPRIAASAAPVDPQLDPLRSPIPAATPPPPHVIPAPPAPPRQPTPAAAITLPPPRPPAAAATAGPTLWDHSGSTMRLLADGPRRRFVYDTPRQGMRDEGVTSGTLLFDGVRSGDSYSGTAFIFSSRCGRRAYTVSGPVGADQRTVTVSGQAPRLGRNCETIGTLPDELVFELIPGQ